MVKRSRVSESRTEFLERMKIVHISKRNVTAEI